MFPAQVGAGHANVSAEREPENEAMKIRNILEKKGNLCHAIEPDRPLTEAVHSMIQHRVGSLVVTENDRLISIVTERDIMWAVGQHCANLSKLSVRDVMAKTLVTCTSEDSLDHAMDLMTRNPTKQRIRHLPVVDADRLAGMISIGDIVHALLTETKFENTLLKTYIKHWPDEETA
jgi:predicted transcriptional regulator